MLLHAFLWCINNISETSLSFNMSPASAIIFIKCQNRHHMKNNKRYIGNTNNTSVINFFNWNTKTPRDVTLLGRTSSEIFVMLVVVFDFHISSDLHFVVVFHLSFFFIHIFFPTSSLTLPGTITGFLHPFYTFSPAYRRVIRDTFIFNHSVIFLPRALRF